MYIYTVCDTRVDWCERQKNAADNVYVNENVQLWERCAKTIKEKTISVSIDSNTFTLHYSQQFMGTFYNLIFETLNMANFEVKT